MYSTIEAARHAVPGWGTGAYVLGVLGIVVSGIPVFFTQVSLPTARWLHWGGWLGAAVFFSIAVSSTRGWEAAIPASLLCVCLALLRAYFSTPYLKIGGRVISFFPQPDADNDLPPRPPGNAAYHGQMSAAKMWWVFAVLCCGIGLGALQSGWSSAAIAPAAVLGIGGFIAGHDDATRGLPVARGQRVPGAVALIGTLPLFGIPSIAYLIGYYVGRSRQRNRTDLPADRRRS